MDMFPSLKDPVFEVTYKVIISYNGFVLFLYKTNIFKVVLKFLIVVAIKIFNISFLHLDVPTKKILIFIFMWFVVSY